MPSSTGVRVRLVTLSLLLLLVLSALAGARVNRAEAVASDLFISEYVEGSSNNKAIEIFNGTAAPVNLGAAGGDYWVRTFSNGATTPSSSIMLSGTIAPGDVFVLAHQSADPTILTQADQMTGVGWFNGNDAVVLTKAAAMQNVDAFGQVGFDPGTEWGTGLTSTMDNTLRRKSGIEAGDTNGADSSDPAIQWDGFANNTFSGLGVHVSGGDAPPLVMSTSPANGAAEVSESTDITINFSEPVAAAAGWYTITCAASGVHTAVQAVARRATP